MCIDDSLYTTLRSLLTRPLHVSDIQQDKSYLKRSKGCVHKTIGHDAWTRQHKVGFGKRDFAQCLRLSIAASSLQPMDASCRYCPTQARVFAITNMRARHGNTARWYCDAVRRRNLGKSVEDVDNRMRNMAQSDAIAISHGCQKGDCGSGVRCP